MRTDHGPMFLTRTDHTLHLLTKDALTLQDNGMSAGLALRVDSLAVRSSLNLQSIVFCTCTCWTGPLSLTTNTVTQTDHAANFFQWCPAHCTVNFPMVSCTLYPKPSSPHAAGQRDVGRACAPRGVFLCTAPSIYVPDLCHMYLVHGCVVIYHTHGHED